MQVVPNETNKLSKHDPKATKSTHITEWNVAVNKEDGASKMDAEREEDVATQLS